MESGYDYVFIAVADSFVIYDSRSHGTGVSVYMHLHTKGQWQILEKRRVVLNNGYITHHRFIIGNQEKGVAVFIELVMLLFVAFHDQDFFRRLLLYVCHVHS